MPNRTNEPAVGFPAMLAAELEEIAFAREKRGVKAAVPPAGEATERARKAELFGLAFSGGGIRSATFNLGVLQGLAKYGVLPELDYLSTVSGGGYIGSWFLSLLKHEGTADQVASVQKVLGPENAHRPEREDQRPISFLRQYSNYLTPRFTFYSADVWTMAATWVRNTGLNLFLLVSALGAILMLPRLLGLWFLSRPDAFLPGVFRFAAGAALAGSAVVLIWRVHRGPSCRWRTAGLAFLALLLIAPAWLLLQRWAAPNCDGPDAAGTVLFLCLAVLIVCLNLCGNLRCGQAGVQIGIVLPLLAGAFFLTRWLYVAPGLFAQGFERSILGPAALLFSLHFALALSGGFWSCFMRPHVWRKKEISTPLLWIFGGLLLALAAAVPAFVSALLLWVTAGAMTAWTSPDRPWFLFTWGPPLVLVAIALGVVVQLGLIGRDFDAAAREWFGRLRAWTVIYSFGWIILCGASIYGPYWIVLLILWHPWAGVSLTGGWLGTTIGGVLSGKSSRTSGRPGAKGTDTGGGNPVLDVIARIAPFVFMAGFILAIAFGIHMVLSWGAVTAGTPPATTTQNVQMVSTQHTVTVSISGQPSAVKSPYFTAMRPKYFQLLTDARGYLFTGQFHWISGAFNLLAILAAVALLLSFRLDINVFSLHEFYKNRLVRCYLGAVRGRERKANPFTGFDDNDDIPLASFNGLRGGRYCGPYPIINATMNVSVGENLAWQERKSAPFVFTPLHSGYDAQSMRVDTGRSAGRVPRWLAWLQRVLQIGPENLSRFGYRPTPGFCYPEGIHLGTAVAVSGAATSPNMGYHTSTSVAFLMTVFDVRLGWWVGNPRREDKYHSSSPLINLLTLAQELFGLTDADAGYVNLSDGGHFDNMGLYELIRRRCRYIIVSDAEQDANLTFASLTTVLRTVRTDFGVEIAIAVDRITKNEVGFSSTHCVVGKITYPGDSNQGYLLYLKSSLTGDEPADVTGYHTGHPEFPHQTTSDQWFTESQFESYRRLGLHVVESAMDGLQPSPADRESFFHELQDRWYPPSERVDRASPEHSRRFTDLTLALASEQHLDELDAQIFTEWKSGADVKGRSAREQLYYATAFIGFMHTVYRDLNLESEHEKNHPHNEGWLRIFRYWVRQPSFHDAWNRTQKMYGERFQVFYNELLKPPGPNRTA